MRTVKKIHNSAYRPIADLITYSPIPSRTLEQIDPFLFLNHHGPQKYSPDNDGLPFGPHPHRGIETVTFIIEGDIVHRDSEGHESTIYAGGIQWMTAGKGLLHAEVSSEKFLQEGGELEILQLWINLPARLKMTEPFYKGLQKNEIPVVKTDGGRVELQLVSGTFDNKEGGIESKTDVFLSLIHMKKGGMLEMTIPAERNIFFYVIRGSVSVNGTDVQFRQLAEFTNTGSRLNMTSSEDSIILLGHALPFNEPVVARGPFVMNTEEEILQAYEDYRKGLFGTWS